MDTSFTQLVGCRWPLQQAAMGGVAIPELAGAVASAGALGMLCEYGVEPATERMTRALDLAGGDGHVGMGFFGQWIDADLETFEIAAAWLRVVEVFWSTPDPALVDRARAAGPAVVAWQVGDVDEAMTAEDAGCDFVIVQGVEAGGHVRGTTPRSELLASVRDRVGLPIVAAGGIATATDVASALAEGADAARVGTRFIATTESNAHPAYVDALLAARGADDTVLTTAFEGGWPDAPHRVLRSALAAAEAFDGDVVGQLRQSDGLSPVLRFAASTPSRETDGSIEAMALYAGMGVGEVHSVQSAADVVRELVSGL